MSGAAAILCVGAILRLRMASEVRDSKLEKRNSESEGQEAKNHLRKANRGGPAPTVEEARAFLADAEDAAVRSRGEGGAGFVGTGELHHRGYGADCGGCWPGSGMR